MKIPFPELPRSELRDASTISPLIQQADQSIGNSIQDLAKGIEHAGEGFAAQASRLDEQARKAKAEADAISQANADTAYQRAETETLVGGSNRGKLIDDAFNETGPAETLTPDNAKDTPGYLSTRGLDAPAQSSKTLEQLEKARQKIAAETFSDPEQKAKWLARSSGAIEDSRRKIETHSAQQTKVAGDDALHGRLQSLQQAIANDTSGAATQRLAMEGEEAIRSLQLSKDGGDAAVLRWQSDVSKTRISSLLSTANGINDNPELKAKYVNTAAQQFEYAKEKIVDADKVKYAIDQARLSAARAAVDVQGERLAANMVLEATSPSGIVDEQKAISQLESIPAGPLRDEARQRLHQRIVAANASYKQDTDAISKAAFSAFNAGGWAGIPATLKQGLNERNPELYDRLRNEAERKWKDHQGGKADARREQAARDHEAFNDYMTLPTAERAKQDINLFLAGRGVSPEGASRLGPAQRRATEDVHRGESERTDAFVADAVAAAQGTVKGKSDTAAFKASAVQAYNDFVLSQKPPRPPTKTEAQALIADGLVAHFKSKPRLLDGILGPGEEAGWEQMARKRKSAGAVGAPASKQPGPDKPKRIRVKNAAGALGWWNGMTPLPAGFEVVGG